MTLSPKLLSLVASAKAKYREPTPAQKIRSQIDALIGDLLALNIELPSYASLIADGISLSLDGLVDIVETNPLFSDLREYWLEEEAAAADLARQHQERPARARKAIDNVVALRRASMDDAGAPTKPRVRRAATGRRIES